MGLLDREYSQKELTLEAYLKEHGDFFTTRELMCSCGCKAVDMDLTFMRKIIKIRRELDQSMVVSSAYRCLEHPEEAKKKGAYWQAHPAGRGIDIKYVAKSYRAKLIRLAYKYGIRGVGLGNTFVHLDDRNWDALYCYPGFKG